MCVCACASVCIRRWLRPDNAQEEEEDGVAECSTDNTSNEYLLMFVCVCLCGRRKIRGGGWGG